MARRGLEESVWAVSGALSQLIRYGIVEREDWGVYRVLDPMVVHYLRGERGPAVWAKLGEGSRTVWP